MDEVKALTDISYREAGYKPRALTVTHRDDGAILLVHPGAMPPVDGHMLASFARWSVEASERVWIAERAGEGWLELTYAQGWQTVQRVAQGLLNLGLGRGESLMILAPNSVPHALATYGALATGAAVCPVTPQYGLNVQGFGKLRAAFEAIRPKMILVADGAAYADALTVLPLAGVTVIAVTHAQAGQMRFADLGSTPITSAVATAIAAIQPADAAKYLLTSGSTGVPKVVINTHRNLCFNAAQIRAVFADDAPITMVNALPWSHSLGANAVLHMLLYQGGSLYIDAGQPTPQRFGTTIENLKSIAPTYHIAVPAAYGLLATELERDADLAQVFFSNLKILQYGGAALGQDIYDRIQRVAVKTCGQRITFAAGYGATETAPTVSNIHWHNDRMGLIGLPVPGEVVKLVPSGVKLEIRVKGDQVTPGYLHDPVRTAEVFDDEGFYKLGDAVKFADPHDPEAGLVFDGRLAEDFKLATGTWVSAGTLRSGVVAAIGGAAADVVVCGEGRDEIGVLVFLNLPFCRRLTRSEADLAALATSPDIISAIATGLAIYNTGKPPSARVSRALILTDTPDPAAGEITDKGYINQGAARAQRAEAVARLYVQDRPTDVLTVDGA